MNNKFELANVVSIQKHFFRIFLLFVGKESKMQISPLVVREFDYENSSRVEEEKEGQRKWFWQHDDNEVCHVCVNTAIWKKKKIGF